MTRATLCTGLILAAAIAPAQAPFDAAVSKVLVKSCASCHNQQLPSGTLNLEALNRPASLVSDREAWERVLLKLKEREMPPPGAPRPSEAEYDRMVQFLSSEFERQDRLAKPNPGRITARRLNRAEYRNTVRDLLGVDFQTLNEFPVDDSGAGFDNIGETLTVSPLLVEKYIDAAERIAARALGMAKLPPKPIQASYADDAHYQEGVPFTGSNGTAQRAGNSFIEARHRIDYDGVYVIQAGLAGQRPEGKPVTMGLWVDGKLAYSEEIASTRPKTVYFSPFEMREFKVRLTEGVHAFRLGFANDTVGAPLNEKQAFDLKSNKYPQYIGFLGPEKETAAPDSRKGIMVCDPAAGLPCIERIVGRLARRAYRRPVTPTDVAALMKVASRSLQRGLSADHAVKNALVAMLVSPDFLFRIERDPKFSTAVRKVNGVELASRLSYFLWSSMPDEELLALGESGKLSQPAIMDAQIKRMMADPRAAALADNFAGQWLETRNLDSIKPAPEKFPEWTPELKEAMRTETAMFFDAILRENRPAAEFLDARYTFLNETLAGFYGIAGVSGPQFRRVELTTQQRGGVLGHASVLAVSSYPTRTSVVIRGKFILENILGTPPPPPPANVPPIDESTTGQAVSLRQQMEKHRSDAVCASCHSKMDPLGFALENYNAIGKWRTADGKFPVDATGTLPDGSSFNGPAEMRSMLARKLPLLTRCLTEKMLTYALGRALEPADRPILAAIDRNWKTKQYRFQDLLFEVAHSLPFLSRRPETVSKEIARK